MEQMPFPDVQEQADNARYEHKFLTSLESGSIALDFPRYPYNSHRDPDTRAARQYLEEFTDERPEHSFLIFQTMSSAYGFEFPHLVKVDIPEDQPPESTKEYVEEFVDNLLSNPPEGLVIGDTRRSYYKLVHNGETYFAVDATAGNGKINFLDKGFITHDSPESGRVLNSA